MIIYLEQKKMKTELVWNHFYLRFILNYNTYIVCTEFFLSVGNQLYSRTYIKQ